VIDGFAALKKLEKLVLEIRSRSQGSINIFKGFLQLPLLKKFSLTIIFITDKEWGLLQQFLQRQNRLRSLKIHVIDNPPTKAHYLQQNLALQNTIKCLENKPLLKSLALESSFWSLEALSEGLSHLKMKNQFLALRLKASDDLITSDTKPWERSEGLCTFIQNQKRSLKILCLILPFAFDDKIITYITKASSKLTQLRDLDLSFNLDYFKEAFFMKYFGRTLQKETSWQESKQLIIPKKWSPTLAKYLKRLGHLENFTLSSRLLGSDSKDVQWFVDVIQILPSLEKLQNLNIKSSPPDLLSNAENKFIGAMLDLQNIRKINVCFYRPDTPWQSELINLSDVVNEINQIQGMRCEIMF